MRENLPTWSSLQPPYPFASTIPAPPPGGATVTQRSPGPGGRSEVFVKPSTFT